jgi:hypothetical protein
MIVYLMQKLDSSYNTVKEKVEKIKNEHIEVWKNEYDQLTLKELPSKEKLGNYKTVKSTYSPSTPKHK